MSTTMKYFYSKSYKRNKAFNGDGVSSFPTPEGIACTAMRRLVKCAEGRKVGWKDPKELVEAYTKEYRKVCMVQTHGDFKGGGSTDYRYAELRGALRRG